MLYCDSAHVPICADRLVCVQSVSVFLLFKKTSLMKIKNLSDQKTITKAFCIRDN